MCASLDTYALCRMGIGAWGAPFIYTHWHSRLSPLTPSSWVQSILSVPGSISTVISNKCPRLGSVQGVKGAWCQTVGTHFGNIRRFFMVFPPIHGGLQYWLKQTDDHVSASGAKAYCLRVSCLRTRVEKEEVRSSTLLLSGRLSEGGRC